MKVVRLGSGLQVEPDPIFDGEVSIHRAVSELETGVVKIALVRFPSGARTKWHTHGYNQVLLVTEGKGVVATEDEERQVSIGDLVVVPEGVVHWHGARPGSDFAHVAIFPPGDTSVVRQHATG